MPQKRFTPEEMITKPRQADVLLGQGKKVAEITKALGIADVTDSRWRQDFGGMTTAQAKARGVAAQGIRKPQVGRPSSPKATATRPAGRAG